MAIRGTVVIVTYNSEGIISQCLESLQGDVETGLVKVVVVDNKSVDNTVDIIASRFPWVTLIRSDVNGGFSAGNNLGSRHIEGGWCFFLNPDSIVDRDCIGSLADYLDKKPDIGCIAPAITNDKEQVIISYFPFTTLFTSIWTAVGLHRLIPLNRTNDSFEVRRQPPDNPVDVDRVLGAAIMVSRNALEQVGGFDEQFFLYSEEEDLCLRLHRAGWRVVYFPKVKVIHEGAAATGGNKPLAVASADWSRYLYMVKHKPRLAAELSRFAWLFALVVRYSVSLVSSFGDMRHDRLEGYKLSICSLLYRGYFERELRPPRNNGEDLVKSS